MKTKKITMATIQEMENAGFTKLEHEGYVSYFDKDGNQRLFWIKLETLEFLPMAMYERKGFEAVEKDLTKIISKKYEGLSNEEKFALADKYTTENDKATIAHLKGRLEY